MCQKRYPRLVSPDFFPVIPYPGTHPSAHNATLWRVRSSVGGVALRSGAGAGEPTPRRRGARGTLRARPAQRLHHPSCAGGSVSALAGLGGVQRSLQAHGGSVVGTRPPAPAAPDTPALEPKPSQALGM